MSHNCRCGLVSRRLLSDKGALEKPGAERAWLRKQGMSEAAKVVGGRAKLQKVLNGEPVEAVLNVHRPVPYRLGMVGGGLPTASAKPVSDPFAIPPHKDAATIKEATARTAELIAKPGPVAYVANPDGTLPVRFAHGVLRYDQEATRRKLYSKASLGRLDLDSANEINAWLVEAQRYCDDCGIPRLRGVHTGTASAMASMGDGVLAMDTGQIGKNIYVARFNRPNEKPHLVYHYSDTAKDARQSVLWHELAHHVHQQYGVTNLAEYANPPLERVLNLLFVAYSKDLRRVVPSVYGASNAHEWFAESFALHKMGRSDLIDSRLREVIRKVEAKEAL